MIYIGKNLLSFAMRSKEARLCSLKGRLIGNGLVPKVGLSEIAENEDIFEEAGNKLLAKALEDSVYYKAIVGNVISEKEIECWFNGKQFVLPSAYHLKKDNITTTTLVDKIDSNILKLENFFKANKYKGPISLGNNKLKVGLNLDGTYNFFEGINENIATWIKQIYQGEQPNYKFHSDYIIGYRLQGKKGTKVEIPDTKHFWALSLRKNREGSIVAENENIGVITAHGRTLREAARRVLRTLKRIRLDGKEISINADIFKSLIN